MYETKIQTEDPERTGDDFTDVKHVQAIEGMSDEEFAALARSIMVVIPYRAGEGINAGICSHFGMWGRIGMRVATIKDPFGGFIEITRGSMVDMFMSYTTDRPEVHYMVMIDNDEGIEWDAPLRLARHGLPIVSGVVCGYNPQRGIFACFTAKDENGTARFPSFMETKKLPADGLIEAEQVGMGLVCVRRDVLEALLDKGGAPFMLPEDLRKEAIRSGTLPKGEDIVFCEKAKELGFPSYVDLSVHAMHWKTIPINWPMENIDPDLKVIDWKPSKFDYKGA